MTSDHRIFDKAYKLSLNKDDDNDEMFQEYDNNEKLNR